MEESYNRVSLVEKKGLVLEQLLETNKIPRLSKPMNGGGLGRS